MEEEAIDHIYSQNDLPTLKALLLYCVVRILGYKLSSWDKVSEAHFLKICMIYPRLSFSAAHLQMKPPLSDRQISLLNVPMRTTELRLLI